MIDGRQFRKRDIASNVRGLFHTQTADELIRSLSPVAWFRADAGVTVTGSGAAQVNDQANSDHALVLPGVAGNYASTPDSVAASITGDIDIRVRVALNDWTPATTNRAIIGKYVATGNQKSFLLEVKTTGLLQFYTSADGATTTLAESSVGTGFTDGAAYWVRVTRVSATGAAKIYTAADSATEPTSWTQLGTDLSTTAGGIFDGTAGIELGAHGAGASDALGPAKIYRAIIKNGIDGTTVVDFNAADFTKGSTSATSSTTGEVWTVNQSGNPPAHIGNKYDLLQVTDASRPPYLSYSGTKYLYLPGVSGNYADTPDSAGNSITGDIDIRWYGSLTDWTPAAFVSLVSKWVGADANSAYDFGVNATGTLSFVHVNGTTQTIVNSSAGTSITDGADSWVRVTWKQSTGATNFYKSSDGTTWTQVGTADVAGPTAAMNDSTRNLAIGATVGGTANFISGRIYRAIIKNGIDGTTVVDFNPGRDASDGSTSFASSATGETWTVNSSGGLPAQIVGRNSLLFDGSADYLKCAAFTLNQPETVYIAFKQVSWAAGDYIFDGNTQDTGVLTQAGTTPGLKVYGGILSAENDNLAVGAYGVACAVFNGASGIFQINNTTALTGDYGALNMGGFTLGATPTGTVPSNIQVLEVIIFSTAHDANQRARVISALQIKHGI